MKSIIMKPQPSWPEGTEPDRITNIKGGFVDGYGVQFTIPFAMSPLGTHRSSTRHSNVIVDREPVGHRWCWVRLED